MIKFGVYVIILKIAPTCHNRKKKNVTACNIANHRKIYGACMTVNLCVHYYYQLIATLFNTPMKTTTPL